MNILVLTPLTPLHQEGGLQNRVWQFWRRVARLHNVTVMCFDARATGPKLEVKEGLRVRTLPLKKDWRRFVYAIATGNSPTFFLFNPSAFWRACHEEAKEQETELVVADHVWCAPTAKRFGPKLPTIFFSHGFEAVIWDRMVEQANFPKSLLLKMLSRNLRQTELDFFSTFTKSACIFEGELEYVIKQTSVDRSKLFLVPNGVHVDHHQPFSKPLERGTVPLLFLGSMNYLPNDEGMRYFLDEVFPILRKQTPDLQLKIVGPHPFPWLVERGKQDPSIQVTGFVENLASVFEFESICIVPIWVGSGSRGKILEYWSHGLPVVSTTVGAEGLVYEHQKNILIADQTSSFAQAITRLLRQPTLRRELGAGGRKTVDELYDWDKITEDFEEFLRSHLSSRGTSR